MARMEMPNDKSLPLVRQYVAGGEKVIISVKGYSMRPFLEHLRDRVQLSPWRELKVGDAVLAEIAPGHFVLHRIIAIDGEALTLMGDGNVRGTEHCTTADVCGVVTEYLRPSFLSLTESAIASNVGLAIHLSQCGHRLMHWAISTLSLLGHINFVAVNFSTSCSYIGP